MKDPGVETPLLKLALVGCGMIPRAHWKGVQSHAPLVQVTVAVDTDRARAGKGELRTVLAIYRSMENRQWEKVRD